MQKRQERIETCAALMREFARRTGLTSEGPATRYLWTDAFAVCNLIALGRLVTGSQHHDLARRLIDEVHATLGRHRADDPRTGWLSELDDETARQHPTRAGLRIGKPLPERKPDEPVDESLEWERDGQYFHYLTKWMHVLDKASSALDEVKYLLWAAELAETAAGAFVYTDRAGRPAMFWKMSIDLARPLMPSMGQHDPLDGYVTFRQIEARVRNVVDKEALFGHKGPPCLEGWLPRFAWMIRQHGLDTTDSLGLGGLLADAARLYQVMPPGGSGDVALLMGMLRAASAGLARWSRSGMLSEDAGRRLAFRELGLAIGIQAVEWMKNKESDRAAPLRGGTLDEQLDVLGEYSGLGEQIVEFWLDPANQRPSSWGNHKSINEVMLATALVPEGFLVLKDLER